MPLARYGTALLCHSWAAVVGSSCVLPGRSGSFRKASRLAPFVGIYCTRQL